MRPNERSISLQKFAICPLRFLVEQFLVITRVIYETKSVIGIYHIFTVLHLKLLPKCIECCFFIASKATVWIPKLKTFNRWVPMSLNGIKKLLQIVSHDLWAQKWKIVFHGNWNPRACSNIIIIFVGSLPFSKRFFFGYSGFPLSSKTNS